MHFIITTNREVAEKIAKHIEWEEKMFPGKRSYILGKVDHNEGYSDVQIKAREELIKPSDIFWLGHYSANW